MNSDLIAQLNFDINAAPVPGGSYESVVVRDSIAYISIQFPIENGNYLYQGTLGKELQTMDGIKAAELCAVNVLRQVNKYIGLEKVSALNHIEICYQSTEDWDDGPAVADGASKLFINILQDRGQHTRSIFGVFRLPRNFCIGITCTFQLAK